MSEASDTTSELIIGTGRTIFSASTSLIYSTLKKYPTDEALYEDGQR